MRKKKGKRRVLIAKIALEKTYDRVDWGFLKSVVDTVGFQKQIDFRATIDDSVSYFKGHTHVVR